MESISKCLVDDMMFDRMECYNKEYKNTTFQEFHAWNMKCIATLSDDEFYWLGELCKRINQEKINLVDAEHCGEFTACCIYFNKNKTLCIMNPR